MPRMIRSLLALGTFVLAALPAPAAGQVERIEDYFSHIEVAADGMLTVSEVITVQATGEQIKRGIYRDFPTIYRRPGGGAHRVGFEIVEVRRDGEPIAYFTENRSNGVRVYMGSKNKFINPGIYTYIFTYKTDRQLGFFETHDELYWNVTGNDWVFPIDVTSVFVQLPDGTTIMGQTGYTGRRGEKGADFVTGGNGDSRATFQTTRTLAPGEGFTIVVTWPKGYVTPPGIADRLSWWLLDYLPVIAGISAFAFITAFYVLVWLRVGRDPTRGTIIPRWKAPRGISPAAVRFISRMDFDNKAIGVAIVSLAVKGYLVIEDEGSRKYRMIRRQAVVRAALSRGERALEKALFLWDNVASIRKGNHHRLKPAVDALNSALSRDFEGVYFFRNLGVFAIGMALSILAVFATGVAAVHASGDAGMVVFVATLAAVFGLNFLFVNIMKAPTLEGRRVMDEIEGFKMYLSTAEQERLNLLHPPERTPELFERYLPYAMALDVETEWGDQFKDVLAAAASGDGDGYRPVWYHGSHDRWSSPGRMAGGIGSSLGGAIASAATPPGSSSGSGGGGSSGGGGGGGGGGGF